MGQVHNHEDASPEPVGHCLGLFDLRLPLWTFLGQPGLATVLCGWRVLCAHLSIASPSFKPLPAASREPFLVTFHPGLSAGVTLLLLVLTKIRWPKPPCPAKKVECFSGPFLDCPHPAVSRLPCCTPPTSNAPAKDRATQDNGQTT